MLFWYAVYTASRAEKKIKQRLDEAGIENYLPLRTEIRIWTDRKKKIQLPLISGYIFVHISPENILKVLNIPGVVTFLKEKAVPVSIPDIQMHRLQMMVEHAFDEVEFVASPVNVGDTVRVKQGNLEGLIGELVEMRGKYKIAIRLQYFGCALTTIPVSWVEKLTE
ncbi:UpxY family transcription antiterminator [Odoribacter lunatus]|uniref:UpxY family transcription antiterminator n=1 Tax=Odoribacter lunatus TaxID=2941335 RepID=UPI00203F3E9F|nr:UpxY family transcription antiterminator [Odoribacter lunatus]